MATSHYNFPTINGTDTIDAVNAINGLANATDAALFGVAGEISEAYTLPIAGTTSLGGVRGSGDISVNASTGDMAINANAVGSNELQTGAVTNSKLAKGSVGSGNLMADVLTMLQQGAQAYTDVTAAPQLYRLPDYTSGQYLTSGTIYSNYVVNPSAHSCQLKIDASGVNVNLPASNTSLENPLFSLGTIPTQYRPASDYATIIWTQSGSDGYAIVYFLGVSKDGAVGIYHINSSSTRNGELWSKGTLHYVYGAQAAS
jgi:hypothetical protein